MTWVSTAVATAPMRLAVTTPYTNKANTKVRKRKKRGTTTFRAPLALRQWPKALSCVCGLCTLILGLLMPAWITHISFSVHLLHGTYQRWSSSETRTLGCSPADYPEPALDVALGQFDPALRDDTRFSAAGAFGPISIVKQSDGTPCARRRECSSEEEQLHPGPCAWMAVHNLDSTVLVQIVDGDVHINQFGLTEGGERLTPWAMELNHAVMASAGAMNDSQFFIYLGDKCPFAHWQRISRRGPLPPVLCAEMEDVYNKSRGASRPIFTPPRSMFRSAIFWDKLHKLELHKGNDDIDLERRGDVRWEEKKDKAVFRGSTTGEGFEGRKWQSSPRGKLAHLSRQHADVMDAGLTRIVQVKDKRTYHEIKKWGLAEHLSMKQQAGHKIVIVPDGNSVADRLPYQMLHDVAIVKPNSRYKEFWYEELQPWVHYIPAKENLSDVVPHIRYALRNQSLLRSVAKEGKAFLRTRMTRKRLDCYWHQLLHKLGTLQNESGIPVLLIRNPEECVLNATSA